MDITKKHGTLSVLASPDPIGAITSVHGPVVRITCTSLPPLHQALKTHTKKDNYVLEVYQHLDQHNIRAITLHKATGLRRGLPVYDTGAPIHVPVSPACLGRLLDFFGNPLDGGEPMVTTDYRNILRKPPPLFKTEA